MATPRLRRLWCSRLVRLLYLILNRILSLLAKPQNVPTLIWMAAHVGVLSADLLSTPQGL